MRTRAAGLELDREHFLTTRYLRDYFSIFHALNGRAEKKPPAKQKARR